MNERTSATGLGRKETIELARFVLLPLKVRGTLTTTMYDITPKGSLPVILVRHQLHKEPFAKLHAKVPKFSVVSLGNEDGRNRDVGCIF